MKKDILKLFYRLLIILLVIGTVIIYCEIRLKELPNIYSTKRYFFEKNLDSTQVIILGNSHAMEGINPAYLKMKAFNLACYGQSLYYDKEIMLKYIDRMPRLKVVLIPISYFSLWYEVHNYFEVLRENFYSKFWDVKINNQKIFDIKRISYVALYGASFTQNAFRKNFKIHIEALSNEAGWCDVKHPLPFEPSDYLGKEKISYVSRTFIQDDAFEDNMKYLETLLSELTKRNVTPVFITIPVHITYYDNADPERIKIIKEAMNKLCLKYHCKYFNYFSDSRFKDDDFSDIDHLNPKGVEKFSGIVENEILSIER